MSQRRKRRRIILASTAIVGGMIACSSSGTAPPGSAPAEPVPDATAVDGTMIVDASSTDACVPGEAITPARPLRILMVTKETLFRHDAAHEAGDVAVPEHLRARGHAVTVSGDSTFFAEGRLDPFDVVVFFVTSGDVVTEPAEQAELVRFVHSGRGIVATHTASAMNNDWSFMYELIGATFGGHGESDAQVTPGRIDLFDAASPLVSFLPRPWTRSDEWYFYNRNPMENAQLSPLLMLDESSIEPYRPLYPDRGFYGDAGHPLAWTQFFECSRVFYTSFGHTGESYAENLFLDHLTAGIEWAGAQASTSP